MEALIPATVHAETSEAFIVDQDTTLLADGLSVGEHVLLLRLGPSGNFVPVTNKEEAITLSALPSFLLITTFGTYKVQKFDTTHPAEVGYINSDNIDVGFQHSLDFAEQLNSKYIALF